VHTQRWVNAMVDRGHDVLLISHEDPRSVRSLFYNPYREMGLMCRIPKLRALVAEKLILRAVARFSPHLVHMHSLISSRSGWNLLRRLNPVLVSVWGADVVWDGQDPEPRSQQLHRVKILAHARQITATSRFLARQTERILGGDRHVTVVPFGVDCEAFAPAPHPTAGAVPVIGFLKHFLPKYGPDVLLRAASLLAAQGVQFRLEMYGTHKVGPYLELASRLGLRENVRVEGPVPHEKVPEVLRGFDIYAMPSIYESETFGVSALEASACGVPVVASRVGGVPETVLDGLTGILVPPSDPAALAAALRNMLESPERRLRMGEAGRRFVLETYRWEWCVAQMEKIYSEIASGVIQPVASPSRNQE
jgi:glycosyltransferase involved in cell wall biosynthesis